MQAVKQELERANKMQQYNVAQYKDRDTEKGRVRPIQTWGGDKKIFLPLSKSKEQFLGQIRSVLREDNSGQKHRGREAHPGSWKPIGECQTGLWCLTLRKQPMAAEQFFMMVSVLL